MPDQSIKNTDTETRTVEPSAQPCDCSRPVDLVHLARYTMGDRVLEREVLELFRTHSRLQLDRLVDAVGDPNKWRDAAHTIKGSARGIGAWKLAEAAEAAEVTETRSGATLKGLIETIRAKMTETNLYIETLCATA